MTDHIIQAIENKLPLLMLVNLLMVERALERPREKKEENPQVSFKEVGE